MYILLNVFDHVFYLGAKPVWDATQIPLMKDDNNIKDLHRNPCNANKTVCYQSDRDSEADIICNWMNSSIKSSNHII